MVLYIIEADMASQPEDCLRLEVGIAGTTVAI